MQGVGAAAKRAVDRNKRNVLSPSRHKRTPIPHAQSDDSTQRRVKAEIEAEQRTYENVIGSSMMRGAANPHPSIRDASREQYSMKQMLDNSQKEAGGGDDPQARAMLNDKSMEPDEEIVPNFVEGFIHPQGPFKIRWDLMLGALIIYSTLIVPFRIAFEVEPAIDSVGFVTDWLIDAFFFCDICVNFRTGFLDLEDELVVESTEVYWHYFKGWFTVDFCSTFPFDYVGQKMIPGSNPAVLQSSKLLKVLRLFRLLKLIRLLKLGKIIGTGEEGSSLNPSITGLLKMFLQLVFIAHLMGCLWHYTALQTANQPINWVSYFGVEDSSLEHRYVVSLYWAFTTMTTVGYGDIKPANDTERAVVILGMLIGASVFGYVIGNVTSMMDDYDKKAAGYQESMDKMMDFMLEKKFPPRLQMKIRKHFKNYYKQMGSVSLQLEVTDDPLNCLATTPACTLLFALKQDLVQKFTFLQDHPPLFVAGMLQYMKPFNCEVNEILYLENELGIQLFLLAEGEVQFYIKRKQKGLLATTEYYHFSCLFQNSYFGEVPLLLESVQQPTAATATRPCELFVVEKECLLNLLESFPKIGQEMQQRAENFLCTVDAQKKKLDQFSGEEIISYSVPSSSREDTKEEEQDCFSSSTPTSERHSSSKSLLQSSRTQMNSDTQYLRLVNSSSCERMLDAEKTKNMSTVGSFHCSPMHTPAPAPPDGSPFHSNQEVLMESCNQSEVHSDIEELDSPSVYALPKSRICPNEMLDTTVVNHEQEQGRNRRTRVPTIDCDDDSTATDDELFKPKSRPSTDLSGAALLPMTSTQDFLNSHTPTAESQANSGSFLRRISNGLSFSKRASRQSMHGNKKASATRAAPTSGSLPDKGGMGFRSQPTPREMLKRTMSRFSSSKQSLHTQDVSENKKLKRSSSSRAVHPAVSIKKWEKRRAILLEAQAREGSDAVIQLPGGMTYSLLQIPHDAFWRKTGFFHPNSTFKGLWDISVGLLIVYSVIDVTYRLSFNVPTTGNWQVAASAVDVLFALDMAITFRTAIYVENNIIIQQKEIAKCYLKSWFIIDFSSTLPINMIFQSVVSGNALRSTKLLRAMRLIRLVKVVRLLKMSSFFQKYEDSIPVNPTMIRFLKLFIIMSFAAHLYGCVFYAVASNHTKENTWVNMYCISSAEVFYEQCLADMEVGSHYLAALYWAFTTMTTVGYGDILPDPTNTAEIIVTFITQVSATSLFAYIIGNLVNLVLNINPGDKVRKSAVMDFNCFLADLNLNKKQIKNLRRHFNHRIQAKPVFLHEQEELLETLPVHLRIKVVYFLYRNHLKKLPALGQFERKYRGFLSFVLPRLKPCLFSPGEQIVTQYISAREMYFVLRGLCNAFFTDSHSKFREFKDGDYFAEATLTVDNNQQFRLNYYVKAQTRCQMLAMDKRVFEELEMSHPHVARTFESEIISHESKQGLSVLPFVPEQESEEVLEPSFQTERETSSSASGRFRLVSNTFKALNSLQNRQSTPSPEPIARHTSFKRRQLIHIPVARSKSRSTSSKKVVGKAASFKR